MSSKKPGAQPGNKNALKHGFYSKRFTAGEKQQLEGHERLSVESEIDLLRVYLSRIAEQVELDGELSELDLKAVNTMALMTQSIGTMLRTQHLMKGKGGEILDTIEDALSELRAEMGI